MDMNGRSISTVLRDIVQDIQDIVRSEIRLAKTELAEQAGKAKGAGTRLAGAAVCGFFGVFFVLLAVVFGLSNVLPNWAAAGIVGVTMAIVGGIMYSSGRKRLREVHPVPEHTVETVKANIQWAKQQTK